MDNNEIINKAIARLHSFKGSAAKIRTRTNRMTNVEKLLAWVTVLTSYDWPVEARIAADRARSLKGKDKMGMYLIKKDTSVVAKYKSGVAMDRKLKADFILWKEVVADAAEAGNGRIKISLVSSVAKVMFPNNAENPEGWDSFVVDRADLHYG